MAATLKRGGAALLAVLTALLLTLSMATAAAAHGPDYGDDGAQGGAGDNGDTAGCGIHGPHDDAQGDACDDAVASGRSPHDVTHPGSGGVDSVENDSPADAVNVIRDYGLENAPIIIGVIGAIFLVGLTFYLVRRGLMKARGAMRL